MIYVYHHDVIIHTYDQIFTILIYFICNIFIFLIQDQDFGEKYHDGDVEYAASDVDANEKNGDDDEEEGEGEGEVDGFDKDKDHQKDRDGDDGDEEEEDDDVDEQVQDSEVDKFEDVNDANIKGSTLHYRLSFFYFIYLFDFITTTQMQMKKILYYKTSKRTLNLDALLKQTKQFWQELIICGNINLEQF